MDAKQLTGYIKEIGRGKNAARDLSHEDARTLFTAILNNDIPPLQLGAILIAMRIKGESLDELAGFLISGDEILQALGMGNLGVNERGECGRDAALHLRANGGLV